MLEARLVRRSLGAGTQDACLPGTERAPAQLCRCVQASLTALFVAMNRGVGLFLQGVVLFDWRGVANEKHHLRTTGKCRLAHSARHSPNKTNTTHSHAMKCTQRHFPDRPRLENALVVLAVIRQVCMLGLDSGNVDVSRGLLSSHRECGCSDIQRRSCVCRLVRFLKRDLVLQCCFWGGLDCAVCRFQSCNEELSLHRRSLEG